MAGKNKKSGTAIKQLGNTARSVRTALAERLLMHGFYAGQDRIMLKLGQAGSMTPGQLATETGVRPPTVTKTINRLQEQGFVDRQPSKSDGRQSHVSLTEKGKDAIGAIEKAIRKTEKAALRRLTKKDRRQLQKLLAVVEENIGDQKT